MKRAFRRWRREWPGLFARLLVTMLDADGKLFAKFIEESQLWHCYFTENFSPVMVVKPARRQDPSCVKMMSTRTAGIFRDWPRSSLKAMSTNGGGQRREMGQRSDRVHIMH
jgi:hypothetical protein